MTRWTTGAAATAAMLFGGCLCVTTPDLGDDDFDERGDEELQGSGLAADRTLGDLTTGEWQTLCTWSVDARGGEGVHECGEGWTVELIVDDCVSESTCYAACTATVGDMEACVRETGDNPCWFAGSSCETVLDCVSLDCANQGE